MAEKLSASPLGQSNLSPDQLVELVIADGRFKQELDQANARYRAHRSKMEKAGVDLKALADLQRLAKRDNDERRTHLKTLFRYAQILDLSLAHQADLFGAVAEKPGEKVTGEKQLWAAEQAGYTCATEGGTKESNPYEPGSPAFVRWDKGYNGGTEFMKGTAELKGSGGRGKRKGTVETVSARRGGGRRGSGKEKPTAPNTSATGHA